MKKCSKCKKNKKLSEFGKRAANKDGLRYWCKECSKENTKQYRLKHPLYDKQYRKNNIELLKKRQKQWVLNNPNKRKIIVKKWKNKNKQAINQYNLNNKFRLNTRILIVQSFKNKGFKKNTKSRDILGCNYKFFYNHLKQSFINNYNRLPVKNDKLHIDHKIPISMAKTEKDIIKLNHYTNLQWLLAEDNLKKGNRLNWNLQ